MIITKSLQKHICTTLFFGHFWTCIHKSNCHSFTENSCVVQTHFRNRIESYTANKQKNLLPWNPRLKNEKQWGGFSDKSKNVSIWHCRKNRKQKESIYSFTKEKRKEVIRIISSIFTSVFSGKLLIWFLRSGYMQTEQDHCQLSQQHRLKLNQRPPRETLKDQPWWSTESYTA